MKNALWLILLAMFTMSGCSHTARLYPVQGPLSSQTPAPVLVGKITGAFNSGDLSVKLSDGETCKGRWSVVHPPQVAKGENAAVAQTTTGMAAAWDAVYGPGFYVSHVLGTRLHAQAELAGDRGTVLNVEMYRSLEERAEALPAAIKGVAKDNKDNIYKVAF
jgi:hypothetical protein